MTWDWRWGAGIRSASLAVRTPYICQTWSPQACTRCWWWLGILQARASRPCSPSAPARVSLFTRQRGSDADNPPSTRLNMMELSGCTTTASTMISSLIARLRQRLNGYDLSKNKQWRFATAGLTLMFPGQKYVKSCQHPEVITSQESFTKWSWTEKFQPGYSPDSPEQWLLSMKSVICPQSLSLYSFIYCKWLRLPTYLLQHHPHIHDQRHRNVNTPNWVYLWEILHRVNRHKSVQVCPLCLLNYLSSQSYWYWETSCKISFYTQAIIDFRFCDHNPVFLFPAFLTPLRKDHHLQQEPVQAASHLGAPQSPRRQNCKHTLRCGHTRQR